MYREENISPLSLLPRAITLIDVNTPYLLHISFVLKEKGNRQPETPSLPGLFLAPPCPEQSLSPGRSVVASSFSL